MKWALVLSGGGAKGVAHVGLIKELERRGYPKPSFIAGTSMGAILGGLYALGWTGAQLEEYCLGFDIKQFLDNPAFRLPDFALSRILRAGAAVGSIATGPAVDSGAKPLMELERLFGDRQFSDLKIPYACVATDLLSGSETVLDSGPLALAIRASMSFPGIFLPVELGGKYLVDGGVVNNLPCSVAYEKGYKHILASDVSDMKPMHTTALSNGIQILLRSFDIASELAQKRSKSQASLRVIIDGPVTAISFNRIPEAIQLGEKAAQEKSDELERFFTAWPFHLGG